jgi:hypothetical protein
MVLVMVVPSLWRLQTLRVNGIALTEQDYRGFWCDQVAGVGIATIVCLIGERTKLVALALLAFWSVAHYGAYEHVRALGVWPDLTQIGYLGDETFLNGSALKIRRPRLLMLSLATSILGLFLLRKHHKPKRWLWAPALALLALLGGLLRFDAKVEFPGWRQTHFVLSSSHHLFQSYFGAANSHAAGLLKISPETKAALDYALAPDLSGTPIVDTNVKSKPNVLLVIIEGVCGSQIEAIRKHHGLQDASNMPYLSELCEKHLYCSNWVTQQRQSNRGEYMLLSGNYCRLASGTPKATEAATTNIPCKDCLPLVLGRHGYQSAFLQACNLRFMYYDVFMKKAGFTKVLGEVGMENALLKNSWGPDDVSLYNASFEQLQEMSKSGQPWFATVVTNGTHHPYDLVPKDFQPAISDSRSRCFAYADHAVKVLLEKMENAGMLKNTLVLITSDESAGFGTEQVGLEQILAYHLGFLIAIPPTGEKGVIADPYGQTDLALSVLDYLGLAQSGSHPYVGRSLFRKYANGRPVFFGNCYGQFLGVFRPDREVHVCDVNFRPMARAQWGPDGILRLNRLPLSNDSVELLEAMARTASETPSRSKAQTVALYDKTTYQMVNEKHEMVFGGQFLSCDEECVIVYDVDLKYRTTPTNHARVETIFRVSEKKHEVTCHRFVTRWASGGRLKTRLIYHSNGPVHNVEFNQYITRVWLEDTDVEYSLATASIVPISEWRAELPPPGKLMIHDGVSAATAHWRTPTWEEDPPQQADE